MSDENSFDPGNIFNENEGEPEYKSRSFLRSNSNVVIAGVCAGTARYFSVDPGNVRLLVILSTLFGSLPILIYIIAALIIPKEKGNFTLSETELILLRKENAKVVLSGILLLIGTYFALSILGLNDGNHLLIIKNDWLVAVTAISAAIYLYASDESSFFPNNKTYPFFNKVNEGKLIFGVCKGLSDYTSISTDIIRVLFVICSLLTLGIFAFLYILLAVSTTHGIDNNVK